MTSIFRSFMRALEPPGLQAVISRLMLAGMLVLIDSLVLLYLSSAVGGLMSVAAAAATSLVGALIVGSSFARHSRKALSYIRGGEYPGEEFTHLAGLFPSLILVCVPGLFTALLGSAIYLPPVRRLCGMLIHRRYRDSFDELYAYSRASEE